MKKIIVIICILMIFLLTGCQVDQISPNNEVSLQYDSLDNFYGDETLEKSFSRLTKYQNNREFVEDNDLQTLTDTMNEYSLSILSGFVIGEEFKLDLSDYSTLNQQTNTTNEDVNIIRFENINYP